MAGTLINHLNHSGNEALTVGERIKLFFSELSTEIDAFNAANLNSSIHVVNTYRVFDALKKKNNFFNFSSNQIPTPVFFNPKKTSFREYTSLCISAIGLLDIANDELARSYKAIKECAATGKLAFSIRSWDHTKALNAINDKLDQVFENTGQHTRTIAQVYPNLSEADDLFTYYNNSVKNLKSRDTEIVSKKVADFVEILKILKRKVDASDIRLSPEDFTTVELVAGRVNELVSTAGRLIGMLNDLARHLELQIEAFRDYAK